MAGRQPQNTGRPAPSQGPAQAAPTGIQRSGATAIQQLAGIIQSKQGSFAAVAARHFDAARMVKLAQAALSKNPLLASCSPGSVLVTLMRCAELGLEPGSPIGGMHLVPYKNKRGGYDCQGIIDYRGFVDLVRRSGELLSIYAEVRYEKDSWKRVLGTEPRIEHEPADDDDRGEIKGFYAVAKLRSGEVRQEYMSKEQVDKIRSRSRAGQSGPWVTDYEEMGRKTVLRRICKLLPMSSEARKVIADEEAIDAGKAPVVEPSVVQEIGYPVETDAGDEGTTASIVEGVLAGAQAQAATVESPEREPGSEG